MINHGINCKPSRRQDWTEANSRLMELRGELQTLERIREQHYSDLAAVAVGNKKTQIDEEARLLISGQEVLEPSPHQKKLQIFDKIENLNHRARVVAAAIELQREALDRITSEVSKEICADLEPHYADLVNRIVGKALELEKLLDDECSVREEIRNNGAYDSHIKAMPMPSFGLTRDWQSAITKYLVAAVVNGYVKPNRIPEHVRTHIPAKEERQAPAKPAYDNDGWIAS